MICINPSMGILDPQWISNQTGCFKNWFCWNHWSVCFEIETIFCHKDWKKRVFYLTCFFLCSVVWLGNLESLVEVSCELSIARFEMNCKRKYVDVSFFSRNVFEREGCMNFRPPINIHVGIYTCVQLYISIIGLQTTR